MKYHNVVAHVPNFQLSTRSSSFFCAFFLYFYGTLFYWTPDKKKNKEREIKVKNEHEGEKKKERKKEKHTKGRKKGTGEKKRNTKTPKVARIKGRMVQNKISNTRIHTHKSRQGRKERGGRVR